MSEYRIEIADTSISLADGESKLLWPIRLTRRINDAEWFEFVLFDNRLISKAALRSPIRLSVDDNIIFSGRVFSEETFSNAAGTGKYITAMGSFGWCDYVRAADEAGIPKLQFSSTTVGAVIAELLERHSNQLQLLGAAGDNFYELSELSGLTEPIDNIWFENRSVKSAITELISLGNYALTIEPENLRWDIKSAEQLDVYELNLTRASASRLIEYRIKTDLANRASAIKLVSDRKASIGYASASPAWDSSLESSWRIRCAGYNQPDDSNVDDDAWVYRRYSYAGISGLLENYPIELVQKLPNESGGYSYQIIETLPVDRDNKYIVAKWPVLSVPASARINRRNGLVKGKSQAGEVYIRYRYYESEPEYSERYPAEGFAGQAVDTAGLICEDVQYFSDIRQVSSSRALREWRNRSKIYQTLSLTVKADFDVISTLLAESLRISISGSEVIELPKTVCFLAEYVEYDFSQNLMYIKLKGTI